MSLFPCDIHHGRIRGSLDALYISLLRGADRRRARLRVCSQDLDALLAEHQVEWREVADDDGVDLEFDNCYGCQAEVSAAASWAGFVTVYRKGSERTDYFTLYCNRCGDESINRFQLKDPTDGR